MKESILLELNLYSNLTFNVYILDTLVWIEIAKVGRSYSKESANSNCEIKEKQNLFAEQNLLEIH